MMEWNGYSANIKAKLAMTNASFCESTKYGGTKSVGRLFIKNKTSVLSNTKSPTITNNRIISLPLEFCLILNPKPLFGVVFVKNCAKIRKIKHTQKKKKKNIRFLILLYEI